MNLNDEPDSFKWLLTTTSVFFQLNRCMLII
jgi:hypothetical protein